LIQYVCGGALPHGPTAGFKGPGGKDKGERKGMGEGKVAS